MKTARAALAKSQAFSSLDQHVSIHGSRDCQSHRDSLFRKSRLRPTSLRRCVLTGPRVQTSDVLEVHLSLIQRSMQLSKSSQSIHNTSRRSIIGTQSFCLALVPNALHDLGLLRNVQQCPSWLAELQDLRLRTILGLTLLNLDHDSAILSKAT